MCISTVYTQARARACVRTHTQTCHFLNQVILLVKTLRMNTRMFTCNCHLCIGTCTCVVYTRARAHKTCYFQNQVMTLVKSLNERQGMEARERQRERDLERHQDRDRLLTLDHAEMQVQVRVCACVCVRACVCVCVRVCELA